MWALSAWYNGPVLLQACWRCKILHALNPVPVWVRLTTSRRITSIALFIIDLKTTEPYHAHLLGIIKPPALIALTLPYRISVRPMFSEMSFKCRSTSSFSSYTLVGPNEDTLYTLYPTRPEKAYGLGIYAPKASSTPSFLTNRPSLRSIRSQAPLGVRPLDSSPLPPLPVFGPEKYNKTPAPQKDAAAPRPECTLRRNGSRKLLRAVHRSPKFPVMDRAVSSESLSSVYSRSISGDKHSSPLIRPPPFNQSGQTSNSSNPLSASTRRPDIQLRALGYRALTQPARSRSRLNSALRVPSNNTVVVTARLPLARGMASDGALTNRKQPQRTYGTCYSQPQSKS